MKKSPIVFSCFIVVTGLLFWAFNAQAYQFYSEDVGATGGCAQCHGAFRSGKYTSLADGAAWGVHLHAGHLNETTIGADCGNCHWGAGTSGRLTNLRSSQSAADGVNAISCSGCHGRLEDANGVNQSGTGWGAGLRQHHYRSGVSDCLSCHADSDPAAFTPVGEDVMPAWYGSVTNNVSGTTLDPCNTNGAEDFAGTVQGNDNDGDLDYDGADSDCQAGGVCGDGTVDTGEDCDDGAANGTTTCGCQSDCTYASAGTLCEDGEYCNGEETCDGTGTCQAGTAVDCNDGVGCTDDSCDEVGDTCVNAANDANCPDDGLFCTGAEYCDTVTDCDSTGNPCTEPGETCVEPDTCVPPPTTTTTLFPPTTTTTTLFPPTTTTTLPSTTTTTTLFPPTTTTTTLPSTTTCVDIPDKGTCNMAPDCEWIGSPKNGSCQDIPAAEICDSGIDEDGDGLVDCDDPDCAGVGSCPALPCADIPDRGTCNEAPDCEWIGSKNNGTCQDATVCVPDETPEATCTDGVDNDCDGMTDCADTADCGGDPACQGGSCDTYTDKTSCQSNGCTWSNKDKVCM